MRKLAILILIILSCVSCLKSNSESEASEKNQEIVEKLFTHFNNHNWEAMTSLYIENAEFKDPAYGIGTFKKTHKEKLKHYRELNAMFPDIKDSIVSIYPSGDKHIAVEFISTGKSVDGYVLNLPIIAVLTIENGLITKDFVYYDNF